MNTPRAIRTAVAAVLCAVAVGGVSTTAHAATPAAVARVAPSPKPSATTAKPAAKPNSLTITGPGIATTITIRADTGADIYNTLTGQLSFMDTATPNSLVAPKPPLGPDYRITAFVHGVKSVAYDVYPNCSGGARASRTGPGGVKYWYFVPLTIAGDLETAGVPIDQGMVVPTPSGQTAALKNNDESIPELLSKFRIVLGLAVGLAFAVLVTLAGAARMSRRLERRHVTPAALTRLDRMATAAHGPAPVRGGRGPAQTRRPGVRPAAAATSTPSGAYPQVPTPRRPYAPPAPAPVMAYQAELAVPDTYAVAADPHVPFRRTADQPGAETPRALPQDPHSYTEVAGPGISDLPREPAPSPMFTPRLRPVEPVTIDPFTFAPIFVQPGTVGSEPAHAAERPVAFEPIATEPITDESATNEALAVEALAVEAVAVETVAAEAVAAEPVVFEPVVFEPFRDVADSAFDIPLDIEPASSESDTEVVTPELVTSEPVASELVPSEPVPSELVPSELVNGENASDEAVGPDVITPEAVIPDAAPQRRAKETGSKRSGPRQTSPKRSGGRRGSAPIATPDTPTEPPAAEPTLDGPTPDEPTPAEPAPAEPAPAEPAPAESTHTGQDPADGVQPEDPQADPDQADIAADAAVARTPEESVIADGSVSTTAPSTVAE